jgi:RNA polymerase sigma-70 factor (ECF subfamily)
MSLSDSDNALVERSRDGDRLAFEELVRRTARMLFARLYLETGDVHRTEDLVQETFLTAWRSIRQVSDASGFRPWLFSVAHTTLIDSLRRETRKKRSGGGRADPDVLGRLPAPDPGPPEVAQLNESRQQVLSVLRSLPEEYRLPLMLRYIAGADYDSIGRQLGLTNGSLRGLLHRGMAMMRAELTKTQLAQALA